MMLINTDGMALIGPGSEWFWAAISGLVLAATFIAILRQLRLQRSATTFQQAMELTREWDTEAMLRNRLAVLEAQGVSLDPAKLPEFEAAQIGGYWERVGNLVAEGHVDPDQVEGSTCRVWWARLRSFTEMGRDRFHDPEIFIHWERLERRCALSDARAGRGEVYDQAHLAEILGTSIETVRRGVRQAELLRGATTVSPAGSGAGA
jgi:hypothetical protein